MTLTSVMATKASGSGVSVCVCGGEGGGRRGRGGTGKIEVRILMVGLEAAGKTAILYNLKVGEVTTIATIGYECAVGGLDKFRPLWHHHYQDTNGLIYVGFSNDRDRVEKAKMELNKMMNEAPMGDAVVLVFCAGKMTSLLAATLGPCGGSHGFWRSWCGASVGVCQTFSSPSRRV